MVTLVLASDVAMPQWQLGATSSSSAAEEEAWRGLLWWRSSLGMA
jgi:hypothetical protein